MSFWGYFFLAFLAMIALAIIFAWWQKFLANRPDRYGKGPGHELRGPERGQWDRIPTDRSNFESDK